MKIEYRTLLDAEESLRRNLMLISAAAFGVCNEGGGDRGHLELFQAIGGAATEALKDLGVVLTDQVQRSWDS